MVIALAAPSAAQEPPDVPVVRVASVSPVIVSYPCGAIDPDVTWGEVVLARTGDLSEGLAVTAEVTTDAVVSPSGAVFGSMEATTSIGVGGFGGELIEVTLLDGDTYDLGEPSTVTVPVDDSAVERECPPYAPPQPPEPPEPHVGEPSFTG
jgi:hypothetical protein